MGVQRAYLAGGRLHLQHGPIDLVIKAEGDDVARAYGAAEARLETVLSELMGEIDLLRMNKGPRPEGAIARTMWDAASGHDVFVTPMAGVAGAVAEAVLQAMLQAGPLTRAYVNNGGDIALHLGAGAAFSVAMAAESGEGLGKVTLRAADTVRGIATSGQGGRSLSFGIAGSVTVLARTAAQADVAASLICNAVDLPGHPEIRRAPACALRDDSDLGTRMVVAHVGHLLPDEIDCALGNGMRAARQMQALGQIVAASLHLRGQSRQLDMKTTRIPENA